MWEKIGKIALGCVITVIVCSCGSVSKNVRNSFPPKYGVSGEVYLTVNSYVNGGNPPMGSTFEIFTPKELENDLEFKEYAGLLSAFLTRAGYVPATNNTASYVAVLNYGIDHGRTEVYGFSGTSMPVGRLAMTQTQVDSDRVFHLETEITLIKNDKSKKNNSETIANVKIVSEGGIGILRSVMPLIMDSAVMALGHSGVFATQKSAIKYFSANDKEAKYALLKVNKSEHPDLLIFSAQNGDLLTVRALLNAGVSPNTRGGKRNRSALEWATYSGNIAVVSELLKFGASVDQGAINQASSRENYDVLALLQKNRKIDSLR